MGAAAAGMLRWWTAAVKDLLAPPLLHGGLVRALSCFSFALCLAGHRHSVRLAAFDAGRPGGQQALVSIKRTLS